MTKEPITDVKVAENSPKGRKRKWLLWTLIILFLLGLFGYLALQNAKFQNWITDQGVAYLNKSIKGDIALDNVEIDLPFSVNLNEVLVTSVPGDTAIYAGRIELGLLSTITSMVNGTMDFSRVSIQDALVKVNRAAGGYQTNVDSIFQDMEYFYQPNYIGPAKPKKPIDLQIEEVFLTNVRVLGDDKGYGSSQDIWIPKGQFRLESLDIPNNVLTIDDAIFEQPIIKLNAYDGNPPVYAYRDPAIDTFAIRPKLKVVAHHAIIKDAYLENFNSRPAPRTFGPEEINWNDMTLTALNVTLDSFSVREQDYYGIPSEVSFVHEDGFEVLELSSSDMYLTTTGLKADNLVLRTKDSRLKMDYLQLRYNEYADYGYFEDNVILNGRFRSTNLTVDDLRKFKGVFSDNQFFVQNENSEFFIDGRLYGKINSLKAEDLTVRIGDNLKLVGSFSSRNLAVPDEGYLDLKIEELTTSPTTLQQIIPGFNLPDQFDKLGALDFNGRFSGFFTDFVADGTMQTALGLVNMNMKFNALGGRAQAEYSGDLSILDFDLKTWTGLEEFNKAQLHAKVEKGKGLTLESVNADLTATIDFLEFKEYNYKDVKIKGTMAKELFDGELSIQDANVAFNFDGSINFQDSIPQFDFVADIDALDLEALNLSKKPLFISGELDIDLMGVDPATILGNAAVNDLTLKGIADVPINLDSILLVSRLLNNGDQYFSLTSREVDANLVGSFDLGKLSQSLKTHLKKNHPSFTKGIVIKSPDSLNVLQSFRYNLMLKDIEEIGAAFFPNVPSIKDAEVNGYFDNGNDSLVVNVIDPVLNVGNARFDNVNIYVKSSADDGFVELFFDSLALNNQNRLSALTMNGAILLDTLQLELNTLENDDVNVNFELAKIDDVFNLKLLPKDLRILGSEWKVNEDNAFVFSNDKFNVRDVVLTSDQTKVRVYQTGATGLEVALSEFDASIINELWNEPKLDFQGEYNLLVGFDDLFSGAGLHGTLFADTLSINGDDWGAIDLAFESNDLKSPFDFDFRMQRDTQYIDAAGIFFPKNVSTKTYQGAPTEYFDFDLDMENVPLATIEYFTPHVFSETDGYLDFYANLSGIPANVGMRGDAVIREGSLKVNYLNTTYVFDRLDIEILPGYFDFSQNTIMDEIGNIGRIQGGIGHSVFKDFYYDFGLSANEFLAFNTQKGDNDTYYGTGIGSVNGSLRGPFPRPEMTVNATSLEGTTVYIPLEDSGEVGDLDFIVFANEQDTTDISDEADFLRDVRGMNIDINLTMTDDAKTFLIFDERSGDIIESTGDANLKFNITRTGEFTMNGEYVISDGEYLFTLLNFINKPFTVAPGGTIKWTGDPYGAELNLKAKYAKLSAKPSNFIKEYVVGQNELEGLANQTTDIDLEMDLKGQLLSPDIKFNLSFPRLDGILKSYVDSKMRVVAQDENELNRQVFGLIVLGSFLPDSEVGTSEAAGVISNTFSELLSNQLSLYITQLLSTSVEDIGFISDIDFDFSYNLYQNQEFNAGNPDNISNGSQVQFNLKPRLFEDRWLLDLGANYVSNDAVGDEFFAGAFAIEYILTKDRRLRVRAYRRTDNALEGRRKKFGVGLNYQKEYDSFKEFLGGIKENAKKMNKDSKPQG